jgi:hypothetical protein
MNTWLRTYNWLAGLAFLAISMRVVHVVITTLTKGESLDGYHWAMCFFAVLSFYVSYMHIRAVIKASRNGSR